jgi:hypothetical protein
MIYMSLGSKRLSAEREESSSRLCPLFLLVKVAWKKLRTLRREIGKGLGSRQFLLCSREDGAEPVGGVLNAVEFRIWLTALGLNLNNFGRSGFGAEMFKL